MILWEFNFSTKSENSHLAVVLMRVEAFLQIEELICPLCYRRHQVYQHVNVKVKWLWGRNSRTRSDVIGVFKIQFFNKNTKSSFTSCAWMKNWCLCLQHTFTLRFCYSTPYMPPHCSETHLQNTFVVHFLAIFVKPQIWRKGFANDCLQAKLKFPQFDFYFLFKVPL